MLVSCYSCKWYLKKPLSDLYNTWNHLKFLVSWLLKFALLPKAPQIKKIKKCDMIKLAIPLKVTMINSLIGWFSQRSEWLSTSLCELKQVLVFTEGHWSVAVKMEWWKFQYIHENCKCIHYWMDLFTYLFVEKFIFSLSHNFKFSSLSFLFKKQAAYFSTCWIKVNRPECKRTKISEPVNCAIVETKCLFFSLNAVFQFSLWRDFAMYMYSLV